MVLGHPIRPAAGPTEQHGAPPRPSPSGWSASRSELLAVAALVGVAALIRLPYLWAIPQLTDETMDSLRSFAIYQGRALPLTNVAPYVGALYNYVEAAAFWLTGPSVYTPRLLVWLLGALAVGATYWMAREMLGRPAACLAAALLATSGVHVGGNSHVAWSQCTTPLLLAVALGFLHRAVRRRRGPSLLAAGFALGLALQTHPTVLAFLPGAAAYLLWSGRSLFRTRWPYLAFALFLLGYGNMLWYNATTNLQSLRSAQSRDVAYARDGTDQEDVVRDAYLAQQGRIAMTLLRLPAGALDARAPSEYLRDPTVPAYAALTVGGIALLALAGNPLPAFLLLSALLLFPFVNAEHELLPRQGRYLAPLLPLLFTALAAAALRLWQPAERLLSRRHAGPSARAIPGLLAAGALVLLPLLPLGRYYAESVRTGQTNDRFFALLAEVEASRSNDEFVLLDYALAGEKLGGGGTALRTLQFMLTVRGIPHDDLTLEPGRLARRYGDGGIMLVMADKTYRAIGADLPLEPAGGRPALEPPNPYGVYRLGPARARS